MSMIFTLDEYAMLPKPTLRLTIPSLHDALPLDCRVYHPHSLSPLPSAPPWNKHAAVVAHPYAPLGGCYDDPVVDIVAGTLLKLGFLVATFNFRGALGSAGRTSWTARAERADYMSVAGFVAHYVHFLDPSGRPSSEDSTVSEENRAVQVQPPTLSSPAPILLLSGYSYGAMITTHLPPLDAILSLFLTPESGSPAAEIRLRAQHLAEMQSTVISSARDAASSHHLSPRAPRRGVGLRVGGDEENRKSQDSRRSLSMDLENSVRQDAADLLAKAARARRNREAPNKQAQEPTKRLPPVAGLTFRPAYLLVSPLQGIITNLATMSFPSSLSIGPGRLLSRWLPKLQEESSAEPNALSRSIPPGAEDKLTQNPTLAVYGDHDVFVSARKLREWATRLQTLENSHFHAIEVSGAGHFWAQSRKNARILQDMVQTFGLSLLHDAT